MYTLKNAREDGTNRAGITKRKDKIYDIIIDAQKLTKNIVRKSLANLSKLTGLEYKLL